VSIQPAIAKPKTNHPRLNSVFQRLMSIHWWMAVCYLVLFCVGTAMVQLPRDVHKSVAVLSMGLLSWRVLVLLQVWQRKYTRCWPKLSPDWIKTVALHTTLYIFMWAVPVTGYFLSNSFKSNNVKFWGLLLPDFFPKNPAVVDLARSMHFWFSYIFLAFISLHLLSQRKVVKANWRRFYGFMKTKFLAFR
jgi:cytochrome b561